MGRSGPIRAHRTGLRARYSHGELGSTMTLYLADMGIVNALGTTKADVLKGILNGDVSRMVPYGPLLTGRSTLVGSVVEPLAELPSSFDSLDCRNNRLLAAALDQVAATVDRLRSEVGESRIAVLVGTSTSGIAAGENAAETLLRTGRMPTSYHYKQQEIGTA